MLLESVCRSQDALLVVLLLVPASEGKEHECSAFTNFCDKGGLLYPSKELFDFVSYLENTFTDCFSTNELRSDSILDVLHLVRVEGRPLGCAQHAKAVKSHVVKFYVVTRLHFLVKGINRAKEERRRRLQHLKLRRCV